MAPEQISERFSGSSTAVSELHKNGLIESSNGYWKLTDAGRDVCPNRRDAKPEMPYANKARQHGWSYVNVKLKTSEVKPIAAVYAAPAESELEKSMNEEVKRRRGGTRSALNLAIYNNVVVYPGINILKLIRNILDEMPEENAIHIRKTIQNMVHCTKQLKSEGSGNARTLHLNVISAAESGAEKNRNPSIQDDSGFSLMLSDENYLHIRIGANETKLNPEQLARLDHFLARVLPDGVRNHDGARA